MKRNIGFKLLQHFIAIYEYGSLMRSASYLGVGQPTLTKSLKKLESHFDLQLFTRHIRELVATDSGRLLYQKALMEVAGIKDLEATASKLAGGESGSVSIGCGAATADIALIPLIKALEQQGANININWLAEELKKRKPTMIIISHGRSHKKAASHFKASTGSVSDTISAKSDHLKNRNNHHFTDDVNTLVESGIAGMGIIASLDVSLNEAIEEGKLVELFPKIESQHVP